MAILGFSQLAPSRAALWVDTPLGTSGAEEAKRHCAAMCRRVFLDGSWGGWIVIASSPCFFRPCFLRPFRSCRLRLPPARWASRAAASWPSMAAARTLRYSLIAWLGVVYGRHAIRLWSGTLQKWSTPLLCVFVTLLVAGVCFGIWKLSGLRKIDAADNLALRKSARASATPDAADLAPFVYTTNIAMPATNMAIVVIATTIHPRRELGWPCISFLSAATIRIATMRNGASNPLMTAVQ